LRRDLLRRSDFFGDVRDDLGLAHWFCHLVSFSSSELGVAGASARLKEYEPRTASTIRGESAQRKKKHLKSHNSRGFQRCDSMELVCVQIIDGPNTAREMSRVWALIAVAIAQALARRRLGALHDERPCLRQLFSNEGATGLCTVVFLPFIFHEENTWQTGRHWKSNLRPAWQ
jgi:hypothetical protein